MRRFGMLALGITLLAACSFNLTVPLPEQRVQVPLADSQGRVVYPAQTLSFPPPGGVVRRAEVRGTLEADQALNATLALYVRLQDPEEDPSCLALRDPNGTPLGYACPVGPGDEKVGEASFAASKTAPLGLRGEQLTQGVQSGKLWLGLQVQGLPSGLVELRFKDLKAILTLGL
ncbi:hypothetical protein [Thermus sp.]|uniref:hypothetical protein n=1 Tax=Thermus sp. TaxID=275 RepID=UPI0025E35673|nr:hypothetical protein [Thermus sp.]MCS6869393.1 hypothetical protein [Thermus sp.]